MHFKSAFPSGTGLKGKIQIFCHGMGEVQAHAGGLLPVSTGISGKSFFKNIGQITGTDTCAVVPYTQYTAVISGRECKTQPGVCSAVFDCIADDLGEEKVQSSPVGTDGGLRKVGVDPADSLPVPLPHRSG